MSTARQNIIRCDTRKDWLAERRNGIGASDSAGIFGLGYSGQNAWTVWQSKIDNPLIEPGLSIEEERLQIGLDMEPSLIRIFERKAGVSVDMPSRNRIHFHPDMPWVRASLDASITQNDHSGGGLGGPDCWPVELKNVGGWNAGDWKGGRTPLKFQIQVQHQMFVTGAPKAYLFALVGGMTAEVRLIDRDDKFIAAMIPHLEKLWQCVQSRTPPPVDHTYETARVLFELHPDDNGKAVSLPIEAEPWLAVREQAKATIKRNEIVVCEADNRLKLCLGDNTFGVTPSGGVVSWKTQVNKGEEVPREGYKSRVLRTPKSLPKGIEVNGAGFEPVEKTKRLPSDVVQRVRARLFERNDRCHWCKKQLRPDTATLEHLLPLSRGGSNDETNLALACGECNQERGDLE